MTSGTTKINISSINNSAALAHGLWVGALAPATKSVEIPASSVRASSHISLGNMQISEAINITEDKPFSIASLQTKDRLIFLAKNRPSEIFSLGISALYACYLLFANFKIWTAWIFVGSARADTGLDVGSNASTVNYVLPAFLFFIFLGLVLSFWLALRSQDEKVRSASAETLKIVMGYVFGAFTGAKIK